MHGHRSTPLRVYQLGSFYYPRLFGGAEVSSYELSLGLLGRGGTVRAAYPVTDCAAAVVTDLAPRHSSVGIHVPRPDLGTGAVGKAGFYLSEYVSWAGHAPLRADIRAFRPDVIIVQSIRGFGPSMLWELPVDVPLVYMAHDFAFVCTSKGRFRHDRPCGASCLDCRLTGWYNRRLVSRFRSFRLVGPSRFIVGKIAGLAGLPPEAVAVIPNPNRYERRPPKLEPSRPVRFGYVGRLSAEKGLAFLFQALARVGDRVPFELVVAGTGAIAPPARLGRYGTVTALGRVPREAVADVHAGLDVIVLPSLWEENLPGALIEALFASTPALASRVGGVPEVVADGVTGRLLPAGDLAAWTTALTECAEGRLPLAAWAAACAERASLFEPVRLLDRYEDLLKAMVGRHVAA